MKILNLYSGIGGNRKLWQGGQVTAVEHNKDIARIYKDFFPQDDVVVADAHKYLLHRYDDYDFIWSSPPCQSHSKARHYLGTKTSRNVRPIYPDMSLYQEIIFLQHHYSGAWVVENTASYYDPLIQPQKVSRHYFWSNFYIPDIALPVQGIENRSVESMQKMLGFDLSGYALSDRRQVLRNCVNPELGLHVYNASCTTLHTPDSASAERVSGAQSQINMFGGEVLATNPPSR